MKKITLGVLIGIIFSIGIVYATEILTSADSISYTDDKTVSEALDDLLGKADATAEDILEGKTAYVNGELLTGTAKNYQDAYDEGFNDGESSNVLNQLKTQTVVKSAGSGGVIEFVFSELEEVLAVVQTTTRISYNSVIAGNGLTFEISGNKVKLQTSIHGSFTDRSEITVKAIGIPVGKTFDKNKLKTKQATVFAGSNSYITFSFEDLDEIIGIVNLNSQNGYNIFQLYDVGLFIDNNTVTTHVSVHSSFTSSSNFYMTVIGY